MKKYLSILLLPLLFIICGAASCDDNSGSAREQKATMTLMEQASTQVGMPAIINWAEKRWYKMIYELRDNANLTTYSYVRDMNGKLHNVCPTTSVGFGIPYATQYTAPAAPRMVYSLYPDGTQTNGAHGEMLAQPEPNGLHMPASAEGTWVMCLAPDGKTLAPSYQESRVSVYTFPMKSVD